MKPTTEILESIYQNSRTHPAEVFTRLYRYLLRPDIYFMAYKHLYANSGAATRGVNDDTVDGFSEAKVQKIIEQLSDGTYRPHPVRREYIEKNNGSGKRRPLGIPTFTDKLVQEAVRMLLEAVYEPIFSPMSHGFRPGKSCHTALKTVKYEFGGVRWFIEGDIRGCFDAIDHAVLMERIQAKIKDARFMQLLWKFLKAGYMEDSKYHATYSGTPQGGIISPILANIYLHELDKHVASMKKAFYTPPAQEFTYEYNYARGKVYALSKAIRKSTGEERAQLVLQWKEARATMMKIPAKSQTDKAICYVRYADDFLLGVRGDKQDCEKIKADLKAFIGKALHMELSEEKTYITHSNTSARFLGYDIRIRRDNKLKNVKGLTHRTLSNKTEMNAPLQDKIEKFLFSRGVVEQHDGTLEPVKRGHLTRLTPLEILQTYNAELRGLCNYYCMASNFPSLTYFAYLMEYSCLKTLAAKFKSSIGGIKQQFRDGQGRWGIPYETKKGMRRMYFAKFQDCKTTQRACRDTVENTALQHFHTRNSLEARLKSKVCELCGSTDAASYELHHVRKVKDLKGKSEWERCMIAKRRKTLAVCKECHLKIHGKK